ncbi:unnamed protein product [Orchesella dallaii]|uniref:LITAF domain-containing protein n=1 Tax=Orchesella dallaii TaxID=48710 RepID=A0ABP1RZ45_9HEXA
MSDDAPIITEEILPDKKDENETQNQPTSSPIPLEIQQVQILPKLGPRPVRVFCVNCSKTVLTNLNKSLNSTGYCYICCITVWFGILCACCCIPCLMDSETSWWNTEHTCPDCNFHFGTYKP